MAAAVMTSKMTETPRPAMDPVLYASNFSPIQQNKETQNMLSEKIANTLIYQGYDQYSVQKVKKLVAKNTFTFQATIDAQSHRRNVVEQILSNMLNSQTNVRINSNEPVLLIEFTNLSNRSRREVEDYKNLTLETLASNYYIWPVRVFTGKVLGHSIDNLGSEESLRLSLLNVVNTEIGSPNMVQLLEQHCPIGKWDDALISTEAFERQNFLWRSDKHWQAIDDLAVAEGYEVISNKSPISEDEIDMEVVEDRKAGLKDEDLEDSVVDVAKPEASSSDVGEGGDDVPEDTPILVEHPALAELLARDITRPHVQHPTWQHSSESASLLDLVTAQSSRLGPSSEDAEIVEHSDKALAV